MFIPNQNTQQTLTTHIARSHHHDQRSLHRHPSPRDLDRDPVQQLVSNQHINKQNNPILTPSQLLLHPLGQQQQHPRRAQRRHLHPSGPQRRCHRYPRLLRRLPLPLPARLQRRCHQRRDRRWCRSGCSLRCRCPPAVRRLNVNGITKRWCDLCVRFEHGASLLSGVQATGSSWVYMSCLRLLR